jgi:hypothetical protein
MGRGSAQRLDASACSLRDPTLGAPLASRDGARRGGGGCAGLTLTLVVFGCLVQHMTRLLDRHKDFKFISSVGKLDIIRTSGSEVQLVFARLRLALLTT